MLGLIVVVVVLEVVVVVTWVVVVVLVVVVVVEVAAAQIAANRSAVGMFVVTGDGGGVEFDSMISFLKGGDIEVLFTLLSAFLILSCVLAVGNGV